MFLSITGWASYVFKDWQKDQESYLAVFLPHFETVVLKFSTHRGIDFLSGTALFQYNMKWAQKAHYVTFTDSPV